MASSLLCFSPQDRLQPPKQFSLQPVTLPPFSLTFRHLGLEWIWSIYDDMLMTFGYNVDDILSLITDSYASLYVNS
ncbi:Uncharacterized protein TCM_009115 [Theobroma cacao]|uniref:Uncharacterized protein n=1 Tax=Theobroma cacao TaxID=3641 RepID=A0A061E6I1_THECC|nr:Uncharacterized protein TCM_009115 [Theobroma cacao]